MTKKYFLPLDQNIDELNYINFKNIDLKIGTDIDVYSFDLIYFKKNYLEINYKYSNISIYGEKNNSSDEIKIATFFKYSNINYGIEDLLNNVNYLNKMKMKVIFTHMTDNNLWNMKIYIFIEKQFLLSLYLYDKLPRFIHKIILDDSKNYNYFIKYNDIKNNNFIHNISLKKYYKRNLFDHQKKNIHIMSNLENKITNNYNIKLSSLGYKKYNIYNLKDINEKIICDEDGKVLNEDELSTINLKINGGILCDNIGLGKTTSMIGLIAENINIENNTTLLICPTRICKQWINEIENTYDLEYKLISNIRQFKKLNIEDYKNNNLIILNYNFLTNKNYLSFCTSNPDSPILLHNYNWNRLILDEGHEFIKNNFRKNDIATYNYLLDINNNTNKTWIISGTPYNSINDLNILIKFLSEHPSDFNLSYFKHNFDIFYETFFIKNDIDNLDINIPKPNIETIFLDMSPLERIIYDSALDDEDKKIQLCNHIMVSEQHLSILGNTPLPLNEIHTKMTEFYKKKIIILNKRLSNINKEFDKNLSNDKIEELNIKKQEVIENLNINQSKFNIFNNIENKINETEDCPICMEPLNLLTKTMTPCGHIYCLNCINNIKKNSNNKNITCALCRVKFNISELSIIKENIDPHNKSTMGTKIEYLLNLVKNILDNSNDKIIIFSQWDTFIKLISTVFNDNNINNIFINGSINVLNSKIRKFKLDNTLNVVFISSDKSPSGLNLQEASHIILLDSLNTTKENAISIEEQAIGRAVRIGQTKHVSVKRLIMRNTIEHDKYIRNIS